MQDELLDLIDENDVVIGQLWRSEVHVKNIKNVRAINGFIQNSSGQLWIPRRTSTKKIFPLALDASVSGLVSTGESYQQALEREIFEELRINLNDYKHEFIGKVRPDLNNTSCFSNVYLIYSDEVPNFNEEDFFEYYWLTPGELLAKIASGDKHKSDMPVIIKKFFI